MKRALLVAGTGTLGASTYPELVRLGWHVDVVSLEDYASVTPRLSFVRARADLDFLRSFFAAHGRYDAVVDFIHTPDIEALKPRMDLILANTDQFVYLSSYRTYADLDRIVTESTPQWLDVTTDPKFLSEDDYAIPKARGERYLTSRSARNWTIIRPIISFTHFRLDLVTVGAYAILFRTAAGKPVPLPEECRDKHCGVTWGGNTGLQIARLLGNANALGEAFTLGTDEGLTWNDVAGFYEELAGARFAWIPARDYLEIASPNGYMDAQMIWTDRALDRSVDFSKVMRVTGLGTGDFLPCRDAIARELAYLSERPDLVRRFDTPFRHELDAKMDAYFENRALGWFSGTVCGKMWYTTCEVVEEHGKEADH